MKIKREILIPFLRAMISHKDIFEWLRRKIFLIRCEVMYKTCGTKNMWRKYVEGNEVKGQSGIPDHQGQMVVFN